MKTKIFITWILLLGCLFNMKAQQRIIGGQTIDISQVPYQVGIFAEKYNDTYFGGGFLLNNQWILTAKHVVEDCTNADIKISIGHNNPNSESGNPNADNDHKSVSNLILHPTADIALVKLSAPVTFTDKIAPIYISNTQSYANNTICEIAG